jgi:hypothetical protein
MKRVFVYARTQLRLACIASLISFLNKLFIFVGFGTTTMIINGAIECGPSPANPTASYNRQNYYRKFAADFNVNINGEKLGTEANSTNFIFLSVGKVFFPNLNCF